MPRYFFDVTDKDTLRDPIGEILDGEDEARMVALNVLSELVPARGPAIWSGQMLRVLVLDANRQPIGELRVSALAALP